MMADSLCLYLAGNAIANFVVVRTYESLPPGGAPKQENSTPNQLAHVETEELGNFQIAKVTQMSFSLSPPELGGDILSVFVQEVSGHYLENVLKEWPEIWFITYEVTAEMTELNYSTRFN